MDKTLEDKLHARTFCISGVVFEIAVNLEGKSEDDAEVNLGIIAGILGIVKPVEKIWYAVLGNVGASVLDDNHEAVANLGAACGHAYEAFGGESA